MILEERIKRSILKHPDRKDFQIADCVKGARASNVAKVRSEMNGIPLPTVENKESGFVSLDKVIQKYDIHAAILKELALVPKGKLISEQELCQRATGTDKNRFRRTVENNEVEFRSLRIRLKLDESEAKWYWSDKDTIESAQRIRDI